MWDLLVLFTPVSQSKSGIANGMRARLGTKQGMLIGYKRSMGSNLVSTTADRPSPSWPASADSVRPSPSQLVSRAGWCLPRTQLQGCRDRWLGSSLVCQQGTSRGCSSFFPILLQHSYLFCCILAVNPYFLPFYQLLLGKWAPIGPLHFYKYLSIVWLGQQIGEQINKINTRSEMSRIQGLSPSLHPDRINPQFIGMGQKYSQHKRNRQDSDRHRQTIESNYTFTLKLNEQLQRNLLAKQKQLQKLQQARKRHFQDINHKLSEEKRREKELQELKHKSKEQRLSIKQGIRSVRNQLKSDRLANKIATKQQLNQLAGHFKMEKQAHLHQNSLKHRSVELSRRLGNDRINSYYRHKNLQSYNNYVTMIEEEDKKSNQNLQDIKKMHSHMRKLEKKIQKKQSRLKEVLEEINLYAVECQNERKANFLATVSVFRPNSTSASWRSRPTDILRTSTHKAKQETI